MSPPPLDGAPRFEDFLRASALSRPEMLQWAARLGESAPAAPLQYAPGEIALHRAGDALQRVMEARASRRDFGTAPLNAKQLGELCTPLAATRGGEGRSWPSAGGRWPVETFVLPLKVTGIPRAVMYHNADTHSLTPLRSLPAWEELVPLLNPHPVTGEPAVVFLLCVATRRTTERYGERGGRFVLIETGAVLQSLSLRAAAMGMAGVALGGTLDRELRELLGLEGAGDAVVLAYACGHPARGRSRRR